MASLARMYKSWFDSLIEMYLGSCITEEAALGDCRHSVWFYPWISPVSEVAVCGQCGLVFSTDEGVFELELVRPFAESLS